MSTETKFERRVTQVHVVPVGEPEGSDGHRDLKDGELISEVDEFWDKDSGKFVPLHACASISTRWMVGVPYSSNFFVRARRPITPSPNTQPSDGGTEQ